jgi:type II secretory pathway pseudopilin PulG
LLLEVAVSVVVLGAVLATAAQVIQWSAAEHRAAQRKRCALEAATTALDRLTMLDWSAITSENAATIRLPTETAQFLINPRITVSVAEEKGLPPATGRLPRDAVAEVNAAPPAKVISVDVSWSNRPGGRSEYVRLSTWVFQRGPVK